jgi:hypothetical protein
MSRRQHSRVTRRRWWSILCPTLLLVSLGLLTWHGWSRLDHRPLRVMRTPVGEAREVVRLRAQDELDRRFEWVDDRRCFAITISRRDSATSWTAPLAATATERRLVLLPGSSRTRPLVQVVHGMTKLPPGGFGFYATDGASWLVLYGVPDWRSQPELELWVPNQEDPTLFDVLHPRLRLSLRGNVADGWRWFAVAPTQDAVTFYHDGGLWLLRMRKPLPQLIAEARPKR